MIRSLSRALTLSGLSVAVSAAIAVAALLPDTAQAARGKKATCAVEGQVIDRGLGWTSIAAPDFPAWTFMHPLLYPETPSQYEKQLEALAVDPFDPTRMFVTDGFAVMRSLDGGCTWTTVFEVPDNLPNDYGFANETTVIKTLVIPENEQVHDQHVYMTLMEYQVQTTENWYGGSVGDKAPRGRVHVLRSDNGGNDWVAWDEGLPATGVRLGWDVERGYNLRALQIVPSDPEIAYLQLFTYVKGHADEQLYVRRPGSPWASVLSTVEGVTRTISDTIASSSPPARPTDDAWQEIHIDPLDPDTLWKRIEGAEPQVSHDGGRTWTGVPYSPAFESVDGQYLSADALEIRHVQGQPAEILMSLGPRVVRSTDGGESFSLVSHGGSPSGSFGIFNALISGKRAGGFLAFALREENGELSTGLARFDPRSKRWTLLGPHYIDLGIRRSAADIFAWTRAIKPTVAFYAMTASSIEKFTDR